VGRFADQCNTVIGKGLRYGDAQGKQATPWFEFDFAEN